jgi:prepilin-type N-terminal cleavage/methylation domain-containing protein
MSQKGFTLLEMTVAMGIFAIVASLAIGAYLSVSKMNGLVTTMRESEQRLRVTNEVITRLGKQANFVILPNSQTAQFYYLEPSGSFLGYEFAIDATNHNINYYTCSNMPCTAAELATPTGTLLGSTANDIQLSSSSGFNLTTASGQPEMHVLIEGTTTAVGPYAPFYGDTFRLDNSFYLENLQ